MLSSTKCAEHKHPPKPRGSVRSSLSCEFMSCKLSSCTRHFTAHAEQLRNLFKSQWLVQGPSLVTFSLFFLFLVSLCISMQLDRRHNRYFPEKEREAVLWPLKEPEEEEDNPEILGV